MSFLEALILGVVEGVTEFLPISSTGHLILTTHLLGIPTSTFVTSFEIAIQLGAILAVVALYWRSFLDLEVLKRVFAAFIPTAFLGATLYPVVKGVFLESESVVLGALFLGGIALIIFEYLHTEREDAHADLRALSYQQAVGVGLCQAVAIIPGVSRSAATILGGLLLGMKRVAIVEFSFLLAVPTMLAATALDLSQSYTSITTSDLATLGVGFVTAFIVALVVVHWFLRYIRTHRFISFGVYRIVVAGLFFTLFIV